MKAVAAKQPSQDFHRQHQEVIQAPLIQHEIPATDAVVLQRKSACPCGGGCPLCEDDMVIQPKLRIGEPGDRYEQEADRVADEVMRMTGPNIHIHPEKKGEINEKIAQRKISSQPAGTSLQFLPSIQSMIGMGQPLTKYTRTFFEPRFGYDLSQVRVHTDTQSETCAKSLQSKAFTFGNHLIFAPQQYQPDSLEGRRLLAHELSHVVQRVPYIARCAECRALATEGVTNYPRLNDPERAALAFSHHLEGSGFALGDFYYIRFIGVGSRFLGEEFRRVLSQWIRWLYGHISDSLRRRALGLAEERFIRIRVISSPRDWIPTNIILLGEANDLWYTLIRVDRHEVSSLTRMIQSEQAREAEGTGEAGLESQLETEMQEPERVSQPEATSTVQQTEGIQDLRAEPEESLEGELSPREAFLHRFETTAIEITRDILDRSERLVGREQQRYTGVELVSQPSTERFRFGRPGVSEILIQQREQQVREERATSEREAMAEQTQRYLSLRRAPVRTHGIPLGFTRSHLEAREQMEAEFPILSHCTPSELEPYAAGGELQLETIQREIQETIGAIHRVRNGLEPGGEFNIWTNPRIVQMTRRRLNVQPNTRESRWIDQRVRSVVIWEATVSFFLAALGLALGILAAAATGGTAAGISLAAMTSSVRAMGLTAATLALSTIELSRDIVEFQAQQAAARMHFDPREALDRTPWAFWIGVSIIGLFLDADDFVQAVRRIALPIIAAARAVQLGETTIDVATDVPRILDDVEGLARREWRVLNDRLEGGVDVPEEVFVEGVLAGANRQLEELNIRPRLSTEGEVPPITPPSQQLTEGNPLTLDEILNPDRTDFIYEDLQSAYLRYSQGRSDPSSPVEWVRSTRSPDAQRRLEELLGPENYRVARGERLTSIDPDELEQLQELATLGRNALNRDDWLTRLHNGIPMVSNLEVPALERILARTNVDHMRGQLVEELMGPIAQQRVLQMQSELPGVYEFVPGYRITDEHGNSLSDGMILRHIEERVEVVAVFEAKAGYESSRGLRSETTSLENLSNDEIEEYRLLILENLSDPELEQYHNLTLDELLDNFRRVPGRQLEQTYGTQIEDLMRVRIEEAGQIRSDIERLAPNVGENITTIRIYDRPVDVVASPESTQDLVARPVDVVASPSRTQFLGVVPADVGRTSLRTLSEQLRGEGLHFERLPLEITQSQIDEVAQRLFAERSINGIRFEH